MKNIIIPTSTIYEPPMMCEDKVIVKQKKSRGYVKNWFCEPMTPKQYEQFLTEIELKKSITLMLKGGK